MASTILAYSYFYGVATATAALTLGGTSGWGIHGEAKAVATASVTIENRRLSASATGRATSTCALTIRNHQLSAFGYGRATSSSSLLIRGQLLSAYAAARATSIATMNRSQGLVAIVQANARATAVLRSAVALSLRASSTCSATAKINSGYGGLGVCDVVQEILLFWGIENKTLAPDFVRQRALNDLNSSMQVVWNQAKDRNYWTLKKLTLPFSAGTTSVALSDSIQNVLGHARDAITKLPLVPLTCLNELDQFSDFYLDGDDSPVPIGYFIERQTQTGKEPVKCTLHITPAPAVDSNILLDVTEEAPRFSWNDVDQCSPVPIPHRYVESLLLPIARYLAMSCHLFIFPERKDQILADYQAAQSQLDAADPLPIKKDGGEA